MNRTALRKILAEEGLLPSRTASAPTALAKLVLTAPGYESLSSRDAMDVAKQLIESLLTEIRDGVKGELKPYPPYPEVTAEADGEYDAVVGSGGGPASGPPGWGDEGYYDVTKTVDFEYPSRMKMEVEVRLDLGGAGLPRDDEGVDEQELFEVLAKSRLWTSIVNDAIKAMWRKGLQKEAVEAFDYRAVEALDEHIYPDSVKVEKGTYKPFNVTYQVKSVDTGSDSTVTIDLVFGASFNAPEID